jgi:hypothetical protein
VTNEKELLDSIAALAAPLPGMRPSRHAGELPDDPSEGDFALLVGAIAMYGSDEPWDLPRALAGRLAIGCFDAEVFSGMDIARLRCALAESPALHVDPGKMARWIVDAGKVVAGQYGGSARWIWNDCGGIDATRLARRLVGIPGIGTAKATVFAYLLSRDHGIPVSGWDVFDPPMNQRLLAVRARLGGHALRGDPGRDVAILEGIRELAKGFCGLTGPQCGICPLSGKCPKQGV